MILLFTIGNILTKQDDQSLASVTEEKAEKPYDPSEIKIDGAKEEISDASNVSDDVEEVVSPTPQPQSQIPPPNDEVSIDRSNFSAESPAEKDEIAIAPSAIDKDALSREEVAQVEMTPEEVVEEDSPRDISGSDAETPTAEGLSKKRAIPVLPNQNLDLNPSQTMSMVRRNDEIIDPDLDKHVTTSLFMRGLKVSTDQPFSFDITFNQDLEIIEIKTITKKNKFSEQLVEIIKKYDDWKKETIPSDLTGTYNYPSE